MALLAGVSFVNSFGKSASVGVLQFATDVFEGCPLTLDEGRVQRSHFCKMTSFLLLFLLGVTY